MGLIGNKYKIAYIDFSYILNRNLMSLKGRNPSLDFTPGDVLKLTLQTLNKVSRDYGITADKFVFLCDKWDRNYGGYYRTYLLGGLYKDTREWMTQEKYAALLSDPTVTPEVLEDARLKLQFNNIKRQSKKLIQDSMRYFGVPSISVEAWECDDLAYLASALEMNSQDSKKSVIITKDSDIQYSITPKVDYFKIPTGGSNPQIITYEEMFASLPQEVQDLIKTGQVSLYDFHSVMESIGKGHNDMRSCMIPGKNIQETILKCLKGDYSNLEDLETYKVHMKTFQISEFPRLQEAIDLLTGKLYTIGSLKGLTEFHELCQTEGITGVTDRYFSEFISRFDPSLYKNE